MAIEYLYDAIRSSLGESLTLCVIIKNNEGQLITDGCYLTLYDDEAEIAQAQGSFDGGEWTFTIPANELEGLDGRYWYTIGKDGADLCFKSPVYLI